MTADPPAYRPGWRTPSRHRLNPRSVSLMQSVRSVRSVSDAAGLLGFPMDVDGVQECTRIGAVRLLDTHKYNQGISWGVDDLDRRRNVVMERCVVAGRSFGCATPALSVCMPPAY